MASTAIEKTEKSIEEGKVHLNCNGTFGFDYSFKCTPVIVYTIRTRK